jgi:signal transduction histidine kinase
MAAERFSEEIAVRSRRFTHLAILRCLLALGYLGVEVVFQPAGPFKVAAGGFFLVYSALLLGFRSHTQVRNHPASIQFIDLISMVVLMVLSSSGEVSLPLLMFYFLITEASLLHGVKEVLLVTMVSLVFYAAWLNSGGAGRFRFSYNSFMFMLVAGGALAYFFSDRRNRTGRQIAVLLRRAVSEPEAKMVESVETALKELSEHLSCSRAVLAFWDEGLDYHALCQYPPPRDPSKPPPERFLQSREWACFRETRTDFFTNDVSLEDKTGKPLTREFDLHPYIIQKFEVYNATGCGLFHGDKLIGRLLLFNSVKEVGSSAYRKVQGVGPLFAGLVQHLLVVKKTEQEAYDRERGRMAHDLHDGPLQTIISFEMRLAIIRKLLERDAATAAAEIESLHKLSRKLVAEMRTFVLRVRPLEGEDASLVASSRRMVEGFQKESGVSVTFLSGANGNLTLPGKLGVEVLQMAREALHNVYKHAQATHVLFAVERKGNQLHLAIDDNGRGFRFGGKYMLQELEALRLGPKSIKRRVRALGGDLTLESNPGQGSNLRVTVPLY